MDLWFSVEQRHLLVMNSYHTGSVCCSWSEAAVWHGFIILCNSFIHRFITRTELLYSKVLSVSSVCVWRIFLNFFFIRSDDWPTFVSWKSSFPLLSMMNLVTCITSIFPDPDLFVCVKWVSCVCFVLYCLSVCLSVTHTHTHTHTHTERHFLQCFSCRLECKCFKGARFGL